MIARNVFTMPCSPSSAPNPRRVTRRRPVICGSSIKRAETCSASASRSMASPPPQPMAAPSASSATHPNKRSSFTISRWRTGEPRSRIRRACAPAASALSTLLTYETLTSTSSARCIASNNSAASVTRRRVIAKKLVPGEGFEPPTFGLQNRCTEAVKARRIKEVEQTEKTVSFRCPSKAHGDGTWRRYDDGLASTKPGSSGVTCLIWHEHSATARTPKSGHGPLRLKSSEARSGWVLGPSR